MSTDLKFSVLRAANLARLPQFKNRHGEKAHSRDDGSDWSIADWITATVGELGEFANIAKKFRRGDITEAEFWKLAKKELGDVQIYLDLLAYRCDVDPGEASRDTFNAVSYRVGANVFIDVAGNVIEQVRVYKCDGGHEAPACVDPLCRWRHPLNSNDQ